MAKILLIIEDLPDGTIELDLRADNGENFPAAIKDWTSAQRAGMFAYHVLGIPGSDLATTDVAPRGHNVDCAYENNMGPCNCPARQQ